MQTDNIFTYKHSELPSVETKKRDLLVAELIAECRKLLKDDFIEARVKSSFIIVKQAKLKGLLGSDRCRDCLVAETINIANDLLRIHKFDNELIATLKKPETLYVYIALVATNCIAA